MRAFLLAALLTAIAAHAAVAQTAVATRSQPVRGQVVDATDGASLRRARVLVTAGAHAIDAVFTDDEGRFALTNVPAGTLTVRVAKAGYVAAADTVPERRDEELRVALTRSAAVTGRVVDSLGLPRSSVNVTARIAGPDADRLAPAPPRFVTQTDPWGEYRLGGLPAGRYEIVAVGRPPERTGQAAQLEAQLFGARGGLELAADAATLVLAAGDEVANVDFTIAGEAETCPTGPSLRPAPGSVDSSIFGRVTTAIGEPIACASVTVVTPGVLIPETYTDRQGRYEVHGLPSRPVAIEARQLGFVSMRYGQRLVSDPGVPLRLRAGEQRTGIDISLPRATISGTVTDEYGEPVEGVRVWAFQVQRIGNRITTFSTGAADFPTTDDRGRYRIVGADPGTYFVAVMDGGTVSGADATDARGYPLVFHPGTADAAAAQRVVVDGSGDLDGVDITLEPTRTFTVSGTVAVASAQPFIGSVTLAVSERSRAASVHTLTVQVDAAGRFTIRNVPPGDFVVKAIGPDLNHREQFGMQYVTIAAADPLPLSLVASDGAVVEGRVASDGRPALDGRGLIVSVWSADSDYRPLAPVTQDRGGSTLTDGAFRLTGVRGPGRLMLWRGDSCASCYLKSAIVNGEDAADRPFDFGLKGGVFRDVEIVIADDGATIDGRVSDEIAAVVPFPVLVYSASPDLRYPGSRFTRTTRTHANGTFRVTGLPPGDYFVAAIPTDPLQPRVDEDPEALERLAERATKVTLSERERRTLTVPVVRP